MTVSPGITGSSRKDLVMNKAAISRSSEAGLPVVGVPPTVALILLVVLLNFPETAAAGTCKVTLKLQASPAASVPPVKLKLVVPDNEEPVPQILVSGSPVAVKPGSTVLRSSVKLIAVALAGDKASWVRVKARVTVSPGKTGSLMNDFSRRGASTISNVAEAGGPDTVVPFIVALKFSVVLL